MPLIDFFFSYDFVLSAIITLIVRAIIVWNVSQTNIKRLTEQLRKAEKDLAYYSKMGSSGRIAATLETIDTIKTQIIIQHNKG